MTTDRRRLSEASLGELPGQIRAPSYDRSRMRTGVVHFGPGVFFQAHVAWHFERLLERDPRWGVCAISLKTGRLGRALDEQDGLYTLAELAEPPNYRVIGAIKECLSAQQQPEQVLARLADPQVMAVTLTVTEKGYCLDPSGALDFDHPDIRADLAERSHPRSLVGWIFEGLRRRRQAGIRPFDVISCDNVASNGPKLRAAVASFATAAGDAELALWVETVAQFPATMVDSITPATDDALRDRVAAALGVRDEAPVQREPFTQWVIENCGGEAASALAQAGAIVVNDVSLYEQAKLRLLNGAHSTLAYLGLLQGKTTVAEAMADEAIAPAIERMMRDDISPTLRGSAVIDLTAYVDAILVRFRNPAVRHQLIKIAQDGSQKLPQRILAPISDALRAGRDPGRLAIPIVAWMRFVLAEVKANSRLDDPLSARLAAIARECNGDAANDVPHFLALPVFPPGLAADQRFRDAVIAAYARIGECSS